MGFIFIVKVKVTEFKSLEQDCDIPSDLLNLLQPELVLLYITMSCNVLQEV